ncbi:MAG: DUF2298 domain-containing protein [Kiritimatiellia bacterium]
MPLIPSHDPFWFMPALVAYLVLHLLALAAWPWWTRLFRFLPDRGAGSALGGGIFVFLFSSQLLWRTGLLPLNPLALGGMMLLIGLGGYLLFTRERGHPARIQRGRQGCLRSHIRSAALQGWLVFTILFACWALIRSSDPGVTRTEQPMDVMWMRAAMAAQSPPVRDAWFGGAPATYYADGHQFLAFLGTLFGQSTPVSVNTAQITLFALTGLMAFQVGKSLMQLNCRRSGTPAGILSVLFICVVSTPRGAIDALQSDGWFWWWRASRVIRDESVELITEFPFFSFWLGDNHAHVIGLPILLLSVLSGIQLLRSRTLHFSTVLPAALAVVWSWRINPWQTPAALAIPFLCLLLRKRRPNQAEYKNILLGILPALLLLYPASAPGPDLAIAFNTSGHSSLVDLFRVFGFLLPGLFLLWTHKPHRLWIALLALCIAMGLCVEIVYLRDAFQHRMNTVFKVYYQLWILIGLLSAVSWTRVITRPGPFRIPSRISLALVLLPGLLYAARLGWSTRDSTRSLHAWSAYDPDIQHLLTEADRLIQPGDRIAEAHGDSYQPLHSLLGTWTAGDTLIGWTGHQQQWRPGVPHPNLAPLYTASSPDELQAALRRLNVDWVLLGPREKALYTPDPDWLTWMESDASQIHHLPPYLLFHIDR